MKRTTLLATAALIVGVGVGAAAPALADYVRLGSVDVGYRMDKDTQWTRFGGGMEGLRLEADGNDVSCAKIVAHFADGQQQNVFTGKLREDRPVNVDLAGGTRHVRDVSFTCRSDERGGAKIYLAAEIGRYKNDWMKSPDWNLFWSRIFNWMTPGPQSGNDADSWVRLGRERFEGRNDYSRNAVGSGGRNVVRLGLTAIGDDARCSVVRVIYGSGNSNDLKVGPLDQGHRVSIDLPGGARTLSRVSLKCQAVHDRAVTIEISARKA